MLTKDLLRFTRKQGRIQPSFCDPNSENMRAQAENLFSVIKGFEGRPFGELTKQLESVWGSQPKITKGLFKLIADKMGVSEERDLSALRERVFQTGAELLRTANEFSLEDYRVQVAGDGEPLSLAKELYSDLNEFLPVGPLPPFGPIDLLHRYNVAQVQGLLFRAKWVQIEILNPEVGFMRFFLRAMRFQRLLAELKPSPEGLRLSLSGPLGIFQRSQAYGSRLAIFFPYLLHAPNWQLKAQISWDSKDFELSLSEASGLKSHYPFREAYVPEEYQDFYQKFSEGNHGWQVALGSELHNLGGGQYGFPDFEFRHPEHPPIFFELFHEWHKTVLAQRINALSSHPYPGYLLGVSRRLTRAKEMRDLIDKAMGKVKILEFTQIPTKRAVLAYLKDLGADEGRVII